MKEIREAVYEVCDRRRSQGKQWGILGYIVGEDWNGENEINRNTYSGDGLRSAFDFPNRYNMVQAVAREEDGKSQQDIQHFAKIHRTASEKGYIGNVYPNLFITNHDIWRLGNLIRLQHGENRDNDRYWARHKMCIGALAVYSGPITLYYGDEVGDLVECWNRKGDCGPNVDGDNCARSDGHISGFNHREQDLHDFTKKVMQARLQHPSMYRGTNGKHFERNTYFNCKYDQQTGDKTVYVTTFNWDPTTIDYFVGGTELIDLVTNERIYGNGGSYKITLGTLGTRIFQVVEGNSAKKVNQNVLNKFSESESGPKAGSKKSNSTTIVIVCICCLMVISLVIGIAIYVNKIKKEQSEADDNDPLLQEENVYTDHLNKK